MVCIMCPSSVFLSLSQKIQGIESAPGKVTFIINSTADHTKKHFYQTSHEGRATFFHRDLGNLYSLLQLGVCGGFYNTLSRKKIHTLDKRPARRKFWFWHSKIKDAFFCADLAKCQRSFYFHKSYLPEYLFLYFRRMFFSVLLLFDKSLMYKFFKSNPLSVEKTVLCSLFSLSDISTSPRQIGFTVFLCLSLLLLLNLSHWQKNRRI